MFGWFGKKRREPGWLAVGIESDAIRIAQVMPSTSGKPQAGRWGTLTREEAGQAIALPEVAKEFGLQGCDCTTLLNPSEYQVLLVDAPSVPRDELKASIRWKIKDLLEYHVDDATVDVLEIPAEPDASGKARSMYAVAAPNAVVHQRISAFQAAQLPLKVIDIPEMAQRNVASFFEQPSRATAMVSFGDWGGLLTFSWEGELLLARRLEVTWDQLAVAEHRPHYLVRVTTELQRSFEHLERQFHRFPVGELLLAPMPESIGIVEHLATHLYVPVREIDLADVIEFSADAAADRTEQWQLFHLFGAALRVEPKAL